MNLESLLLSSDPDVVSILGTTLDKLSIDVQVCREAKAGSEILISEKFDAVIVDCDDLSGGMALLEGLRVTPSNKSSVAFAVLNGKKTTTQQAFGMGANFVMQKPITMMNAMRCFNAALNFMLKERRRYFRQPLNVPVKVTVGENHFQATATNISEGGIALLLQHALPKDGSPRLQLTLPGSRQVLEFESQVAWTDMKGYAGMRFINVPQSSQERLEQWLSQQLEQQRPGAREILAVPRLT
ncbi:MAG TPA: response regulator [Candidatus Binatia bacterium]|nr:response regulator [Candidatus Binatia bacterium]